MKNHGVVRRIDELGRVVLPKEMRRQLSIKEGDEVEICNRDNIEIVVKRFSSLKNHKENFKDYCKAVYDSIGGTILICDRFEFLVAEGTESKFFIGKKITNTLFESVVKRSKTAASDTSRLRLTIDDAQRAATQLIFPVTKDGESFGALIYLGDKKSDDVSAVLAIASQLISLGF